MDDFQFYVVCCLVPLWVIRAATYSTLFIPAPRTFADGPTRQKSAELV
jgi:hypothetical protein